MKKSFDNFNFNSNFYHLSLENRHIFILVFKINFLLLDTPYKSLTHIPTIPILGHFIHVKTKIFLFLIICTSLALFSSGGGGSLYVIGTSLPVHVFQRQKHGLFIRPKTTEIYWLYSLRSSQLSGQLVFRLSLASGI